MCSSDLPHAQMPKTPTQRFGGVLFVAALHVVIVYALLTTLGVVKLPKTISDLQVVNVADLPKDETVPPPQAPVIDKPEIQPTIIPEVALEYVPPQERAITLPPVEPQPGPKVASLQPEPVVTFTPAAAIMSSHTTPDYPTVSRRLGEQGTLRLKLTIGPDGHVANTVLVNSSGHDRLDAAAIEWVKAHWLYQPAKQGSRAVASVTDAVVTFRLQ